MDLLLIIIEIILISIFLSAFFRVLIGFAKRSKNIKDHKGSYSVEYGKGAKKFIFGLIIFFAILFVIVAYLIKSTRQYNDEEETMIFLTLIGLYLIFVLLIICEVYGIHFIVTKEGIYKKSPWSRNFFARWENMQTIKYDILQVGGYTIKTTKGKIRLNPFLSGLNNLLQDTTQNMFLSGIELPIKCKNCKMNLRIELLIRKGQLNKCPVCGKEINAIDYPVPLRIFIESKSGER